MIDLIDACIEGIHLQSSERGGSFSQHEHEALKILVDMRQDWQAKIPPVPHPGKRQAPQPPNV